MRESKCLLRPPSPPPLPPPFVAQVSNFVREDWSTVPTALLIQSARSSWGPLTAPPRCSRGVDDTHWAAKKLVERELHLQLNPQHLFDVPRVIGFACERVHVTVDGKQRSVAVFVARQADEAHCGSLSPQNFTERRRAFLAQNSASTLLDTDALLHIPLSQLTQPSERLKESKTARTTAAKVVALDPFFVDILCDTRVRKHLERTHDAVHSPANRSRQLNRPVQLLSPKDLSHEKTVARDDAHGFDVGVAAMQGFAPKMDSAHTVQLLVEGAPHYSFFGVFDGHGDAAAAQAAANELLLCVQRTHAWKDDSVSVLSLETALRDGFLEFEKQLRAGRRALPRGGDVGATAAVCLVTPSHFVSANLGDCRVLLISSRPSGELSGDPRDHQPSAADEKSRILRAGGFVVLENSVEVGGDAGPTFSVRGQSLFRRHSGSAGGTDVEIREIVRKKVKGAADMLVSRLSIGKAPSVDWPEGSKSDGAASTAAALPAASAVTRSASNEFVDTLPEAALLAVLHLARRDDVSVNVVGFDDFLGGVYGSLSNASDALECGLVGGVLPFSRAFGFFEYKGAQGDQILCEPDVSWRARRAGDDAFLVLASKGVGDALSTDFIKDFLLENKDRPSIALADDLIDHAAAATTGK